MNAMTEVAKVSAVLARCLTVRRGPSTVLDQLDLQVSVGEVVGVQGPSGSGKSTLLSALAGLIRAEGGLIEVAGEQMSDRPDRVRSKIRLRSMGLIFQRDELLPELTVRENVGLPLRMLHGSAPEEVATRVESMLEALGIEALRDRLPSQISGGQLQRAAIARAMIHDPLVVLADEPTASLDAQAARSAIKLLLETARARNAAAIVVTHDPETASACDRLQRLQEGACEAEGSRAGAE